jgi:type I restriction enzyme R subunit
MSDSAPTFREDHVSQVPALQLLINIGFKYITPDETLEFRAGRASNVILDGILTGQLRKMNRVRYKGQEYPFTEGNIHSAVQALKDIMYDGLVRTNEKIYDLICLGKSLQQSINGDLKSFTLKYIDWENPENNAFHCTAEYVVERTGSHETRRPDIVIFVNGIPLVVIECKSPKEKNPIEQAISQHIRNQKEDEIPGLFIYSQLLLSVSMDEAKYATTGTPIRFWSVWNEKYTRNEEKLITEIVNKPLLTDVKDKLFKKPFRYAREYFDEMEKSGGRTVTEQDRAIYSLCRPERLLEMAFRFILFDAGEKKIARYQQYFCVQKIVQRVTSVDSSGRRNGGVIWHTQGSGKSLTMVMLAKALALEPTIQSPRIVIVTDRVDLDEQIWGTFKNCGKEPEQAKTGKHLIDMLQENRESIIATVIDKFEAGVGKHEVSINDQDIFVLVDEGHRTQYGTLHAKMKRVLPGACFIGFTGTPVARKDRNTIERFGGLIDTYTIKQAEKDEAVVPLLYEGRHVPQIVAAEEIDSWFDKLTQGLTKEQKADLKRKFATTEQLNKAEQKVARIAWDISVHFAENWQGTPFKAQLVTQDKVTALLYKKYLDEFAMVSSQVLISGPDEREGETDIYEENKQEVIRFWKAMMQKYGSDKEYNKQLISAFKNADEPEIIIVVDKLLVGFDAKRNTVLYLTRNLKDHTLLQAIARVNRLYEGKDFGYIIDYRGVLENLDQAIDLYGSLDAFERDDLEGILKDVDVEISKLPQRHSELWDIFKEIENKQDVEAYEKLLADEVLRSKFYEKFSAYSRTLAIAFSSAKFLEGTRQEDIDNYRNDLKYFKNLRCAVRRRYAEVIEYSEYEPKIRKLIDTHVGTGEVENITSLVNIFDQDAFAKEVEKVADPAAKADTIAHRTMRAIHERWQEDPAFYEMFSKLLKDVIDAFRAERIQAAEYLNKVKYIMESVLNRTGDDIPISLNGEGVGKAFFGSIKNILDRYIDENDKLDTVSANAAIGINELLEKKRIVSWTANIDIQNQMRNQIEDLLFDMKEKHDLELSFDDIDEIMEQCIDIFKVRRP